MKLLKRIMVLALTLSMTLALVACSDTSWVYDYDGNQLPSGAYIAYTMEAASTARSHEDIDPEATDLFKQTIEGKDAEQWIIDEAKMLANRYMAINNKFEELGLSFSEKDVNEIDQALKVSWAQYEPLYTANSVSESTYRMLLENSQKENLIFEKYYGTGGIEELSNDQLLVHFEDNFARVNIFGMPIIQPLEETLTEDDAKANEELKAQADEYVALFNKGEKTMNELADMAMHASDETEHDDTNLEDVISDDEDTKSYLKKDATSPSETVVKAIFGEMKDDEVAKVIADDKAYYIVTRYDVTEDEESFEEMKDSILFDIKGEDFRTMVDGWAEAMSPTENKAAIKRYTPKNIIF